MSRDQLGVGYAPALRWSAHQRRPISDRDRAATPHQRRVLSALANSATDLGRASEAIKDD